LELESLNTLGRQASGVFSDLEERDLDLSGFRVGDVLALIGTSAVSATKFDIRKARKGGESGDQDVHLSGERLIYYPRTGDPKAVVYQASDQWGIKYTVNMNLENGRINGIPEFVHGHLPTGELVEIYGLGREDLSASDGFIKILTDQIQARRG
jgi:hypothetical protein